MRRLGIAALALALTALAAPAAAFVVEVTTSISMEDIRDEAQLRDALQKTVDSVLSDAIAFRPTVVLLTHALVMRGRLYVRLLMADQEGERTFNDLDLEREPEPTDVQL
ncbi:MAG TPA: hypothetical protein VE932_16135 [Patescibacteria group bacterium]|nr:hypothetical protein [Patescibacteria group bacterium]